MNTVRPAAELVDKGVNSDAAMKLRQAAKIIRTAQELAPYMDELRLLALETQDIVKVYGGVTTDDLAELGISDVTLGGIVTFFAQLIEFYDKEVADGISYRTAVNSVRRVAAQI